MISDVLLNTLAVVGAAVLVALFLLVIAVAVKEWRKPSQRTVVVSARGETKAEPNVAEIGLAMQTSAKTVEEIEAARKKNAQVVQDVLQSVKALDPESKTETIGFRVAPRRDYMKGNKIIDYALTNAVRVRTRRLDQVSPIVDAALAAGVNAVDDIDYTIDRKGRRDAEQRAQSEALRVAREKAQTIAASSNARLGRVLEVVQEDGGGGVRYQHRARSMAMAPTASAEAVAATPISAPESIDFERNVQIKYELV